jgi:hypothetical protein
MDAPPAVLIASVLQFSLAASFVLMLAAAYGFGAHAQEAAEADVAAQGVPAEVLARNGVKFTEGRFELLLPLGIALTLIALGVLNLGGEEWGRVLTWILQSIILLGGGIITSMQVFAVRYVESSFRKSGDEDLQRLDVARFLAAAMAAFPHGFRALVITRFALVTIGSIAVIALLGLPSAHSYFQ